jgi:diacylglycerol kinase
MKEWLVKFGKSFHHAGDGIKEGFKQRNIKVQVLVGVVVVCLGVILTISLWEWVLVVVLVGMVWGAELMNSSIEELANVVRDTNKLDYKATKTARDIAAGAVLVVSIAAAIVGMIIFGSKLI